MVLSLGTTVVLYVYFLLLRWSFLPSAAQFKDVIMAPFKVLAHMHSGRWPTAAVAFDSPLSTNLLPYNQHNQAQPTSSTLVKTPLLST